MNSSANQGRGRHPIGVVAERTGLTPDVLRAWEKRYGVVEPERSDTRRRLYSDADVDRLLLLRRATESGRAIGRIATLPTDDLRALVTEDEEARARRERYLGAAESPEADAFVSAALDRVHALDSAGLDAVLVRAAHRLGTPVFLEDVAAVLLRRIGELWHAGKLRSATEHMATAVIRRVLGWLLWSGMNGRDGRGVLVMATPAGQVHELGVLLGAAAAADEGWRVVYLGADLPAEELARVARDTEAVAVCLSVVYASAGARVAEELRRLREQLPAHTRVIVGGSAAEQFAGTIREIGAERVADLAAFRTKLAGMAGAASMGRG